MWLLSATAGVTPLVGGCRGPYSILDPAGPAAQLVSGLWWAMFSGSVVIVAFILLLWWRALRRGPDTLDRDAENRLRDRWIVAGGIVLPTVATGAMLAFGIPAAHRMLPLPDQERQVLRIDVQAQRWHWQISYPDYGITLIDEIHIPTDTPVDFHIGSADVIHSFWVPRLGGKVDAIPGRINVLRLETHHEGEYGGLCAEFCGSGHAHMKFGLTAHTAESFERWLAIRSTEGQAVAGGEASDE